MRSRSHFLTILTCALAFAAACGDDDGSSGDIDSGTDDQIDASVLPSFEGQVLLIDLSAPAFPEIGNGPIIDIDWQALAAFDTADWEEAPGSPFGCKAWDHTPAEAADPHLDEGTMEFTTPAGYAPIPPCSFVPGLGYACIGAQGGGGDIAVVDADMGLFSLTDNAATFGADQVGRILHVMGTTNASDSGDFPVVAAEGDHTIVFQNGTPGADAEAATPGQYITLAGVGPAGQTFTLADDDEIGFALTQGGDGDLESFDRNLDVGNGFTLDTDSAALLSAIPTDGNEFTLSCMGDGGDCGASQATVIVIDTTDGSIEGLPPFIMPPPETKAVQIICTFLAGSATIKAEGSQFLADSGATRIRANFARVNSTTPVVPDAAITLAAGKAVMGLTDP